MRVCLLLFCVLAAIGMLSGCSQFFNKTSDTSAVEETGKGLALDKTILDFGTIEMGEMLSRRIKLKNESGNGVVIREVKASCDCIQPNISSSEVEAGKTVTVEVLLDSRGVIGTQYHKVTIDTEIGTYEFAVTAEIR